MRAALRTLSLLGGNLGGGHHIRTGKLHAVHLDVAHSSAEGHVPGAGTLAIGKDLPECGFHGPGRADGGNQFCAESAFPACVLLARIHNLFRRGNGDIGANNDEWRVHDCTVPLLRRRAH